MMKALNWMERLVCALVFVAGAWSACIGVALTQRGSMQFWESVFPHLPLRAYAARLQPHSMQMIIVGAAVAVLAILIGNWLLHVSLAPTRQVHGSARFATWFEIWRAGYAAWRWRPRLVLGRHGLQTIALTAWRLREHVMAVAPSGQGKTTNVIYPNLLQEHGDRGVLSNDPKGEQYDRCLGALSRHMTVGAFAPCRLDISLHYNPLAHITSMTDAENFAQCWVENTSRSGANQTSFYDDTSRLLITAMVIHLREEEPGAPLARLGDLLGATTIDQIRQVLQNSKSKDARALGATFMGNVAANPARAADVVVGMATRFMMLRNPALRELTATDQQHPERNLDFIRLVTDPQALFLIIPPDDIKRLKPISACLLMQLMHHLMRIRIRRDFVLYLDELCNIGRIPNYAQYISLVRSMGISIIQCIQDFGQLRREYGIDDADSIIENSNTKIFFPGTGKREAEFASELLGDTTVKTSSSHRGRNGISHTTSYVRRRLMAPDEIRCMQAGEMLMIASNLAPVRMHARPYYKVRRLRKLANIPPKRLSQQTPSQGGQPGGSRSGAATQKAKQVVQHQILIVQRRSGRSGQIKP
jgi:type IV secretory pathway TraG/TraD family ATPase VirD4